MKYKNIKTHRFKFIFFSIISFLSVASHAQDSSWTASISNWVCTLNITTADEWGTSRMDFSADGIFELNDAGNNCSDCHTSWPSFSQAELNKNGGKAPVSNGSFFINYKHTHQAETDNASESDCIFNDTVPGFVRVDIRSAGSTGKISVTINDFTAPCTFSVNGIAENNHRDNSPEITFQIVFDPGDDRKLLSGQMQYDFNWLVYKIQWTLAPG